MIRSTFSKAQGQDEEKQPQSRMPPPPCFAVQVMLFGVLLMLSSVVFAPNIPFKMMAERINFAFIGP